MSGTEVAARPFEHRVVARNSAAASPNVIHADEGAQTMGFRAALVPGNALYCYVESAIRGRLGPAWTERGAAHVRFTAPAYDGDELTATAGPLRDGVTEVELIRAENGQAAVSGTAWLRGGEEPAPPASAFPAAARPSRPAPFSEAWALDSGELRTDPSIHTSSRISHFRRVELGEPVSVRGHIDHLYGRRGNRYYVLDMAYVNERGEVAMTQRHIAIYRLRKRAPAS